MSKSIKYIFKDRYGDFRLGWVFSFAIALACAACFLLIILVRQIDHHYSSKYCQPHLRAINRTGKFVDYNYWDYQCLAKTGNKYAPLDQIYNNIQLEVNK